MPETSRGRRELAALSWLRNNAFCLSGPITSGSLSTTTRLPPFTMPVNLAKLCTSLTKNSRISRRFWLQNCHSRHKTASTSWLSFGTARRRDLAPSHFERGLKPARPGLSLGVFRRFGTMAYIHAVASPNEVQLSATLYYRMKNASRK